VFQAFLEGSLRIQVAAVSFILAKLTFVMTAICMAISDTATIVSMSVYSLLVLNAIVLSMWEGFTKRKRPYAELEEEIRMLKKTLDTMT